MSNHQNIKLHSNSGYPWTIEDIEYLRKIYNEALENPREWTYQRMGDELGRSHDSIRGRIYDLGLTGLKELKNKKRLKKPRYPQKCVFCGKEFIPIGILNQLYCSANCRKNNQKTKYKHICFHCKKEFKSAYKKQKYCSRECFFDYTSKISIEKNTFNCIQCGKTFVDKLGRSTRKFCSSKCHYEYKKETIKKTCEYCGKDFELRPFELKRGRKYCSKECSSGANLNIPFSAKRRKTATCPVCGIKFKQDRPEQIYCSHKCFGVSRKKIVEFTCLNCGVKFEVVPWELKNGERKFCSNKCYHQYKHRNTYHLKLKKYLKEKYPEIYEELLKKNLLYAK